MVPDGQSADQVRPDEYLNGTDSQADSPRLQFKTVRRRPTPSGAKFRCGAEAWYWPKMAPDGGSFCLRKTDIARSSSPLIADIIARTCRDMRWHFAENRGVAYATMISD